MILPLVAAGAWAVCYGVASVLQAVGARRNDQPELELQLLMRLFRELPYLAGLVLDLGGFALGVFALHSLPLFLVQSVIAASVGVTATTEWVVLKTRPLGPATFALVTLGIGIVLLAIAAKPGSAHLVPPSARWALLLTLPVVAAGAAIVMRSSNPASSIGLAAVAGAGFAAVGIAARALRAPHPWWLVVAAPAAWSIVGFGAVAVIAFAAAIQRGSVTVATAVMSSIETIVPLSCRINGVRGRDPQRIRTAAGSGRFRVDLGGSVRARALCLAEGHLSRSNPRAAPARRALCAVDSSGASRGSAGRVNRSLK